MDRDELKRQAGYRAAEYVQSGMAIGLGSGSTARHATLRIAELLRSGELRDIVAVPTSDETGALARAEGIPLTTLAEHPTLDVTIDGADEVDGALNLIKGLGGYLLREKIVAYATTREIIVVDPTKLVERLGTKAPVPVEVVQFGWQNTRAALQRTGARPELRGGAASPYVTDEGNYILDCWYTGGIQHPGQLARDLNVIPGVVENGLFLGMTTAVVIASPEGTRVISLEDL
ncbi:MAG: ribose-5-phosphate isomerase RpiA [Anaerolineae bacterium]